MEKVLPFILIVSVVITVHTFLKSLIKERPSTLLLVISTVIFIGCFFLLSRETSSAFVAIISGVICFVNFIALLTAWYFQPTSTYDKHILENTPHVVEVVRTHQKRARAQASIDPELLKENDLGGTMVQKRILEPVE